MKLTKTFLRCAIASGSLVTLACIAIGVAGGQESASVRQVRDLSYVSNGGANQKLDLYLPQTAGPARPLLIWLHGGGWQAGSKNYCPAKALVLQGYAVASVEYRFSQQALFPAQIEDVKAAVRWLRAHAAEYGIDPTHVGVGGESAGGHLAALLGTAGRGGNFDVGENLDQSSAVQCVVDEFGPTDFLHWGDHPDAQLDRPDSAVAKLLGGTVTGRPELARQASPAAFITAESAPFFILHGAADPVVPVQQSRELHEALQKAGVESTLKIVPGAGHGGPAFASADNLKSIVDFLARHLH